MTAVSRLPVLLLPLLLLGGCGEDSTPQPQGPGHSRPGAAADPVAAIERGEAGLTEVLPLLAGARDAMERANLILRLYYLRGDPEVVSFLHRLWNEGPPPGSGLAPEAFADPALRVALAHTLQRIEGGADSPWLRAIRAHLRHPDPLARAQAAVALGFTGDDRDVAELEAIAREDIDYPAEAAIKSLAIRGSEAAREALVRLRDDPRLPPRRRTIARQVLVEAFREPHA
ncbi:MAG: hypothetical protein D6786_03155 [Gammaproteobacteria bacterium]|nr:MAG: hypothetical protein D6786_03155 [Gammaproteobacteria bacterium]